VAIGERLSGRSARAALKPILTQLMPDLPFYKPHQVADLRIGYYSVNPAYETLMFKYLVLPLTNEAAQEYARHGFVRRLGTLKRAIENVYSIYPPERFDRPTRDECLDIAINLQSFLFNVFGCIDNLACVWVNEKQVKDNRGRPLRDQQIGLRSGCTAVRETFSAEFQKYLTSRDDWLGYLQNYRHASAHRIPLYIAPYTLNPAKLEEHNELERRKTEAQTNGDHDLCSILNTEQKDLGRFTPYMMHSFSEGATPVAFHPQVLADWNTVVEIANEFWLF
jgi:hypothetical protein